MIRILIVDDHPIVRKGLRQIVSDEQDMAVAETGDAREALGMASANPFDVVVLDINLPGMSGIEALSQVRALHPRIQVLILSAHPETEFAIRALRAGAAGYLNKDLAPEELIGAIRRIASGRKYVSAAVAEILADAVGRDEEQPPHETLSDREYEVLLSIAAGRTVSEIAAEMSLSVKTISTYRTRILEKMQLRNNAELMKYALSAGLGARDSQDKH